jgi:transcription factor IIIB subunit 2
MTSQSCSLCSGITEWDDAAHSVVCLDCGNLEDSTQTTLVDNGAPGQVGHGTSQSGELFRSLSTPALKAATGRVLAGQSSKGNRDAANSKEMHECIISMTRILGSIAVAERAQHLFDLAMYEGSFRWGRQAKHAAAACVIIALNENGKADGLNTIAVSSVRSSFSWHPYQYVC